MSEEDINLSILDKVKLIDILEKDEKACLLKMIDIIPFILIFKSNKLFKINGILTK